MTDRKNMAIGGGTIGPGMGGDGSPLGMPYPANDLIGTTNSTNSGFYTQTSTVTADQYRNGFLNYYQQTLGTGIDVDVIDEDDDSTEKDTPTVFQPVGETVLPHQVEDRKPFGDIAGLPVEMNIFGLDDIRYTDYSAQNLVDKTDNFVVDSLKNQKVGLNMDPKAEAALAPFSATLGAVPASVGGSLFGQSVTPPFGKDSSYRPTGLGGIGFDLAMSFHAKNAAAVQANRKAGGNSGALLSINNMLVSRSPGRFQYTGNMQGLTTEEMKRLEATGLGFVPGTLREVEDPSAPGGIRTTGMQGLMSGADALKVGGQISETGYFINYTTGMGAPLTGGAGLKNKEYAAAFGAAQSKYGVTQQQFNAALAEARGLAGFGTVRGRHRNATYLSDALTRMKEANEKAGTETVVKVQTDLGTDGSGGSTVSTVVGTPPSDDPSTGFDYSDPANYADDSAGFDYSGFYSEDDDGSGSSAESSSQDFSAPPTYDYDAPAGAFADGGRVGMQMGGTAPQAAPAGFVERPPSQVSEAATVADDKPMSVPEGTFVINAAAVEFAGEGDIAKMLNDAYKKAGKKGGTAPSKDQVDVAVSRGEVIVPPAIAKIIGYDRLEKINNRGKKETSKRIEENGQQAEGASLGGFLSGLFGFGKEEPQLTAPRPDPSEPKAAKEPAPKEGFVDKPAAQPSTPLPELTPFEQTTQELLQIVEDNKFKGYVPTNNSGVTIGRGFDVGQHSVTDLERMGLDSDVISLLTPYVGKFDKNKKFVAKTGQAARDALKRDPLNFDPNNEAQAENLEEMNVTVQRAKYEDFERVMANLKLNMPEDDASRAAVFAEFYAGNFVNKKGKLTIRKSFMDEVQRSGSVYNAFQEGIVDKLGSSNTKAAREARGRAEKTMSWLLDNLPSENMPAYRLPKLPKPNPTVNMTRPTPKPVR